MAEDTTLDNKVRHFIYQTFISTSKPPTTAETAKRFQLSISRIESTFERLAASHDIALAPGSHSIWMAHPFSALPTNYTAQINQKKYYGNWIWDVFGIAAIVGKDAEGHTPCGCGECNDHLDLLVGKNQLITSEWLVHFVVPAKRFWEKIGFTWATILAFSSKAHLQNWLKRTAQNHGATISLQTCHQLAIQWYSGRAEKHWERRSVDSTQAMFAELGLTGPFWSLWRPLLACADEVFSHRGFKQPLFI